MNHIPARWTAVRRGHRLPILATVVIALAFAVHLGLGGYLLAHSTWTLGGAAVIVAVILGKFAMIVLARKAIRGRRATAEPPRRAR